MLVKDKPSLTGLEAYDAIIDSIEHLQACLKARENLCLQSETYQINDLKLVAGLDNIKSIKNEITLGESILKPIIDNPEEVSKDSAIKWLNDPKRRKAKFYSFLNNHADVSLENLKEFYASEVNS